MESSRKSKLESYLRGLAQSGSLGFADEITAGVEGLFTDKPYEQSLSESREQYKLAELENPKTYRAGEFTADAASMLNPVSGASKLAAKKLALQRLAKGAVETMGRKDGQDLDLSDALNIGMSGMSMKMKSSKDIPWKTGKGVKSIDDIPNYGKVRNIDDKLENAQNWVQGAVKNPASKLENAQAQLKGEVKNIQSIEDLVNAKKILGK